MMDFIICVAQLNEQNRKRENNFEKINNMYFEKNKLFNVSIYFH